MTALEVAQKKFKALQARDNQGVLDCMDENVVLRVPGRRPLAGTYKGHAGIIDFTNRCRSVTDTGEHVEIVDMMSSDNRVAAIIKLGAEHGGHKLDDPTVHVMKVENGKITEYWVYPWDVYAVDEFWIKAAQESSVS